MSFMYPICMFPLWGSFPLEIGYIPARFEQEACACAVGFSFCIRRKPPPHRHTMPLDVTPRRMGSRRNRTLHDQSPQPIIFREGTLQLDILISNAGLLYAGRRQQHSIHRNHFLDCNLSTKESLSSVLLVFQLLFFLFLFLFLLSNGVLI